MPRSQNPNASIGVARTIAESLTDRATALALVMFEHSQARTPMSAATPAVALLARQSARDIRACYGLPEDESAIVSLTCEILLMAETLAGIMVSQARGEPS